MCGGATFKFNGTEYRVYFPDPNAALPVRTADGDHQLVPWGRRREQQGSLPPGGWARLDSIRAGKWERWQPRPVKIDLDAFMEKDHHGKSHWFDLKDGEYIQGLVATMKDEMRLYVVTTEPSQEDAEIHDRWPRVMHE